MTERGVPVEVRRRPAPAPAPAPDPALAIGEAVSGVLRYLSKVIDREDRLEVGTGTWLSGLSADPEAQRAALRQSTLRTLSLAADPVNFAILEALHVGGARSTGEIMAATGLGRLSVAERVADLTSAGLAAKVPEGDQATETGAGGAIVELVRRAVEKGLSGWSGASR